MFRITKAKSDEPIKIIVTGKIESVTKTPTATEAKAPNPICIAPMTAEALPAFFSNGANDNAVVFGLQKPKHPKNRKSIAITPYKLKKSK